MRRGSTPRHRPRIGEVMTTEPKVGMSLIEELRALIPETCIHCKRGETGHEHAGAWRHWFPYDEYKRCPASAIRNRLHALTTPTGARGVRA